MTMTMIPSRACAALMRANGPWNDGKIRDDAGAFWLAASTGRDRKKSHPLISYFFPSSGEEEIRSNVSWSLGVCWGGERGLGGKLISGVICKWIRYCSFVCEGSAALLSAVTEIPNLSGNVLCILLGHNRVHGSVALIIFARGESSVWDKPSSYQSYLFTGKKQIFLQMFTRQRKCPIMSAHFTRQRSSSFALWLICRDS